MQRNQTKSKSIVLPHEHGGWAMASVPYLLGMLVSAPNWTHALLFVAWMLLYLASYPLLQAFKRSLNRRFWIKWTIYYSVIAILFLIPVLIQYPQLFYFGPILVLLFLVNIWHTQQRQERAMLNDLCAILIFTIGGAAAYFVGAGEWDKMMLYIVLFCFLQFTGSTFFVKTVFRERKSIGWNRAARIFHIILLIIPLFFGLAVMMIPYLFSVVRTFLYAGKPLRPMKVGIIEIIGAVQFLILSAMILKWQ